MKSVSEVLFQLISCELGGAVPPASVGEWLTEDNCAALYKLARAHDLTHLVSDALYKNKLIEKDSPIAKKFVREQQIAVFRYEKLKYELQRMTDAFEKEKIPNVPLKGAVMRDYYPEPWMRTSCDIDVLVKEQSVEAATAALNKHLGATVKSKGTHDVSLYTPSEVHIELHYTLIEDSVMESSALSRVWEETVPVEGYEYRRAMPDGMFYLYHIEHMYKHFVNGGCGVRPFIDLYILNRRIDKNDEAIAAALSADGLKKFASAASDLAEVWAGEKEYDDLTRDMAAYILRAGVYGNIENLSIVKSNKSGGKFKYALKRIFLPYDQLKENFPVLKKHKILTPLFEVVRWFRVIFRGNFGRSVREVKTISSVTEEQAESAKSLFDRLEIK